MRKMHGGPIDAFIFDYGQTLWREVDVAAENAERYDAYPFLVDFDMTWIAPDCAILGADESAIPSGRSFDQIDSATPESYVPFRNGIFFAMVAAWGETRGIQEIWAGCNGLASGQYYDDTAEFIRAMKRAIYLGTSPGYNPDLVAPFATIKKEMIVAQGLDLGVDYSKTWSCYRNGAKHCGECDSCYQRAAALGMHGLDIEGEPL
jgi:7-cyano-7-deazaguanine synthase